METEQIKSDDILNCKRYATMYRQESFYVIVAFNEEDKPCEVFFSEKASHDPTLQYMMASWDGLTRFVTMALKKYPLDKVVRQLKKSSRKPKDMPGILAEVLENWL